MARGRKKRKTHRTGRRRVSGFVDKNILMEAAGLIAFVAYGSKITSMIPASLSPTIVNGIETAGGYMLAKKVKQPFLRGAAFGLLATGAVGLMKGFGIAGVGNAPLLDGQSLQIIGGANSNADMIMGVNNRDLSVVSGVNEWPDEDIDLMEED